MCYLKDVFNNFQNFPFMLLKPILFLTLVLTFMLFLQFKCSKKVEIEIATKTFPSTPFLFSTKFIGNITTKYQVLCKTIRIRIFFFK